MCAIAILVVLPIYLLGSVVVVAFERSGHYVEATLVTVAAVLVMSCVFLPPGHRRFRLVEQWASGCEVNRATALKDTYAYARRPVSRLVAAHAALAAALLVGVGAIAGATGSRLAQYAILGTVWGIAVQLIAVHSFMEAALRPPRVALAGDTGIGDSLPRPRPTFAAWSNLSMLLVALSFAVAGAMLAAVFNRATDVPVLWVVIGCALAFGLAVPITIGAGF
jgi:hypothetical protein